MAELDKITSFYLCEIPESVSEIIPMENLLTGEKTSFMVPRNLFDKNADNLIGQYYSGLDGETLITNWQYSMTDKIPTIPGNIYKTNAEDTFVILYDSNNRYIEKIDLIARYSLNDERYFCAPANSAYMRICFCSGLYFGFYVENLSDVDDYTLPNKSISSSTEKNLFERTNGVLYGRYRSHTDGTSIKTDTELGMTDYIPVVQGMMYTSPYRNVFINWYGIDKRFIGITESANYRDDAVGATAPENASYACFIFDMNDIDGFYVRNLTQPEYTVEDKQSLSGITEYNVSQFMAKTWVSFGDSITYRNTWQPAIAALLGLNHINCGIGSTSLSGPNALGRSDLPSFWTDTRLNAVKNADPDMVTILGGANDLTNFTQGKISIGDSTEFDKAMPSDASASESANEYSASYSYAVGDYCKRNDGLYECITALSGGEAWNNSHWKAVKNVDTFYGAYSYIIENLLQWKKTLSIVILGTTWAHNDGAEYSAPGFYTRMSNASRDVAQYYGLPFVDLHGKAGLNKFNMGSGEYAVYSSDRIHPNEEGSKNITKLVLNVLVNEVTIH